MSGENYEFLLTRDALRTEISMYFRDPQAMIELFEGDADPPKDFIAHLAHSGLGGLETDIENIRKLIGEIIPTFIPDYAAVRSQSLKEAVTEAAKTFVILGFNIDFAKYDEHPKNYFLVTFCNKDEQVKRELKGLKIRLVKTRDKADENNTEGMEVDHERGREQNTIQRDNTIQVSCRNPGVKRWLMTLIINNLANGLKHLPFRPEHQRIQSLRGVQVKDWFAAVQQKVKKRLLTILKYFKGQNSNNNLTKYEVNNSNNGISAKVMLNIDLLRQIEGCSQFPGHPRTLRKNQNPNRTKLAQELPWFIPKGIIMELIKACEEDMMSLGDFLDRVTKTEILRDQQRKNGTIVLEDVDSNATLTEVSDNQEDIISTPVTQTSTTAVVTPTTVSAPTTPTTSSALSSASSALKRLAVSPAASQAAPKKARDTDTERKYQQYLAHNEYDIFQASRHH